MKPQELIGQREHQTLEFKAAGVLKDLRDVAREVVAFLNADGGDLWIGISESDGVATALDPIAAVQSHKTRVWDHLLSSIEPHIDPSGVLVVVVDERDGAGLLRIEVWRGPARPYAQLGKGGARHYYVRAGDRVRAMTHAEIFSSASKPRGSSETRADVRSRTLRGAFPGLWLAIVPKKSLSLHPSDELVSRLLSDPLATNNRRTGFTFVNRYARLSLGSPFVLELEGKFRLEVARSGHVEYAARPELFLRDSRPGGLDPLALAERVASVIRLAAVLYLNSDRAVPPYSDESRAMHTEEQVREPQRALGLNKRPPARTANVSVVADLALVSMKGLQFNPAQPGTPEYYKEDHSIQRDEVALAQPIVTSVGEIAADPDACAFRLLSALYRELGYSEDDLPSQFDRTTKRLRLRE
jgi:hypothetical protein